MTLIRKARPLVAPDQGRGGKHGCADEGGHVTVSFWCSRRQRCLKTSERSVLESTERSGRLSQLWRGMEKNSSQ